MLKRLYNSFKQLFDKSKFIRFIANYFFFILVTLIFIFSITYEKGIVDLYKSKREVNQQKVQIKWYKDEIRKTEDKLRELSSNIDSLEKFAREQYLFHAPDEEIFIVREK